MDENMIKAGKIGRVYTETRSVFGKSGFSYTVEADDVWDHKGRNMISGIYISYDEVVRSIQFGYLQENESLVFSSKIGYSDGDNFKAVRLDEDEYVTGLSGTSDSRRGISNFTVYTNRGKYGPFGQGCEYARDTTNAVIDPSIRDKREFGGFFGSFCPHGLTSIGIYLSPIPSTSSKNQKKEKTTSYAVVKSENM